MARDMTRNERLIFAINDAKKKKDTGITSCMQIACDMILIQISPNAGIKNASKD